MKTLPSAHRVTAAACLAAFVVHLALADAAAARLLDERRPPAPGAIPLPAPALALSTSLGAVGAGDAFGALPPALGRVRGRTIPGDAGVAVLHLHDVHNHAEAQERTSRALGALSAAGQLDLIVLEGTGGVMDLGAWRAFPDASALRVAADRQLKLGGLGGGLHAALLMPRAVPVVGAEDPALYRENVDAYREAVRLQAPVAEMLRRERGALDREAAARLPADALDIVASIAAYHDGALPLAGHLRRLAAAGAATPAIRAYLEAADLEKRLDERRIAVERAQCLALLAPRMDEGAMRDLARRAELYRSGRLGHAAFHRALERDLSRHGVAVAAKPAFAAYLRYVALADAIDADRLFDEAAAARASVLARLARKPGVGGIITRGRRIQLAQKLAAFSLTPPEWAEYQSLGTGTQGDLRPFERFYVVAERRNAAMAEAVKIAARRHNARRVALVAGGFHARGVARELERRGIASTGFVPRLTTVDPSSGSAYLSVFAREKAPLEDVFRDERLFLAPPPGEGLVRTLPSLLAMRMREGHDPGADMKRIAPRARVSVRGRLSDDGVRLDFRGATRRGARVRVPLRADGGLGREQDTVEPLEPTSALASGNLIFAVLLVPLIVVALEIPLQPALISTGVDAAMGIVIAFLAHEGGHALQALLRTGRISPRWIGRGVADSEITIRDADGWSGIAASTAMFLTGPLLAPFSPALALAVVLASGVFAFSVTDWRHLTRRGDDAGKPSVHSPWRAEPLAFGVRLQIDALSGQPELLPITGRMAQAAARAQPVAVVENGVLQSLPGFLEGVREDVDAQAADITAGVATLLAELAAHGVQAGTVVLHLTNENDALTPIDRHPFIRVPLKGSADPLGRPAVNQPMGFRDRRGRLHLPLNLFTPAENATLQAEMRLQIALAASSNSAAQAEALLRRRTAALLDDPAFALIPRGGRGTPDPLIFQAIPYTDYSEEFDGFGRVVQPAPFETSAQSEAKLKHRLLRFVSVKVFDGFPADDDPAAGFFATDRDEFMRRWLEPPVRAAVERDIVVGDPGDLSALTTDMLRRAVRTLFMHAALNPPERLAPRARVSIRHREVIRSAVQRHSISHLQWIEPLMESRLLVVLALFGWEEPLKLIIDNVRDNTLLALPLTEVFRSHQGFWQGHPEAAANPLVAADMINAALDGRDDGVLAHIRRAARGSAMAAALLQIHAMNRRGANIHLFPDLGDFLRPAGESRRQDETRVRMNYADWLHREAGVRRAATVVALRNDRTVSGDKRPSRNTPDELERELVRRFGPGALRTALYLHYDPHTMLADMLTVNDALEESGQTSFALAAPLPADLQPIPIWKGPGATMVFGHFNGGVAVHIERRNGGDEEGVDSDPLPETGRRPHDSPALVGGPAGSRSAASMINVVAAFSATYATIFSMAAAQDPLTAGVMAGTIALWTVLAAFLIHEGGHAVEMLQAGRPVRLSWTSGWTGGPGIAGSRGRSGVLMSAFAALLALAGAHTHPMLALPFFVANLFFALSARDWIDILSGPEAPAKPRPRKTVKKEGTAVTPSPEEPVDPEAGMTSFGLVLAPSPFGRGPLIEPLSRGIRDQLEGLAPVATYEAGALTTSDRLSPEAVDELAGVRGKLEKGLASLIAALEAEGHTNVRLVLHPSYAGWERSPKLLRRPGVAISTVYLDNNGFARNISDDIPVHDRVIAFRDSGGRLHLPLSAGLPGDNQPLHLTIATQIALAALATGPREMRTSLRSHTDRAINDPARFPVNAGEAVDTPHPHDFLELIPTYVAHWGLFIGWLSAARRHGIDNLASEEAFDIGKKAIIAFLARELDEHFPENPEAATDLLRTWAPDVADAVNEYWISGGFFKTVELPIPVLREAARGYFVWLLWNLEAPAAPRSGDALRRDAMVRDYIRHHAVSPQSFLAATALRCTVTLFATPEPDFPVLFTTLRKNAEFPKDTLIVFPASWLSDRHLPFRAHSGSIKEIREFIDSMLHNADDTPLREALRDPATSEVAGNLLYMRALNKRGANIHYAPHLSDLWSWDADAAQGAAGFELQLKRYIQWLKKAVEETGAKRVWILTPHENPSGWPRQTRRNTAAEKDRLVVEIQTAFGKAETAYIYHRRFHPHMDSSQGSTLHAALEQLDTRSFALPAPLGADMALMPTDTGPGVLSVYGHYDDGVLVTVQRPGDRRRSDDPDPDPDPSISEPDMPGAGPGGALMPRTEPGFDTRSSLSPQRLDVPIHAAAHELAELAATAAQADAAALDALIGPPVLWKLNEALTGPDGETITWAGPALDDLADAVAERMRGRRKPTPQAAQRIALAAAPWLAHNDDGGSAPWIVVARGRDLGAAEAALRRAPAGAKIELRVGPADHGRALAMARRAGREGVSVVAEERLFDKDRRLTGRATRRLIDAARERAAVVVIPSDVAFAPEWVGMDGSGWDAVRVLALETLLESAPVRPVPLRTLLRLTRAMAVQA